MAPSNKISPEDLKVCRAVHAGLVSKERSKINYLFLEPVDVTYFADYLTIVKRPMDLKTLGENLENGVYSNRNEFYSDTQLIFDNAVLFNKDRPDSNFVVGLAKKMAKAYKREREKIETRELGAAMAADDIPVVPSKRKSDAATSELAVKPEKKKKIKLKIKRNSSAGELASMGLGDVAPLASSDIPVADATSKPLSGTGEEKVKSTQPKFKLKLSKKSKESVEKSKDAAIESKETAESPPPPKKKIKLKISRGKELPKGVSTEDISVATPSSSSAKSSKEKTDKPRKEKVKEKADKHSKENTEKSLSKMSSEKTSSKTTTTEKPTPLSSTTSPHGTPVDILSHATTNYTGAPMNAKRLAQCYKVMSSLKRRQKANCKYFDGPVRDPKIVKDYREKITYPVDLSMISSKLDKNQYETVAHFVHDVRKIAANCLQYNTEYGDEFRTLTVDWLSCAEDLMNFFIAKEEAPNAVYPAPLYCWEKCIHAIDELLKLKNPDDGHQTAWYFLQPVTFFCSGSFPEGYLDKVKKPTDLGTITQKLLCGCYSTVGAFVAECRAVVKNCKSYYADSEDGAIFVERATRLEECMGNHLGALIMFDRSEDGSQAREDAKAKEMEMIKPDEEFLRSVMVELRETKYTDRNARITESATIHFEKPVDTIIFPDYLDFVDTPMNLEAVDRKIDSGAYQTLEDFEYDVGLIFKNCERYNQPKGNAHMVALGKHTAKAFRKLLGNKLRSLERGNGVVAKAPLLPTAANRESLGGKKKRPLSPGPEERQQVKRTSIKAPSRSASKTVSAGKSAGKSVGKTNSKKTPKASGKKAASAPKPVQFDPDVPVPMHVAIASIKESFPGRRGAKELEDWEADCVKFLKQLMRHPWISAERPKYIFHVPVGIIFPEIRESYEQKIEHPMDLTTAEAKLLQGESYENAEEFVSDIALIFSNAITFNQDGHDIGEPMSCAYYEASTHLLKYSRWLSLEILHAHLSDSPGASVVNEGSASNWNLTIQNRDRAREEMEKIVFSEAIEKRYAYDRKDKMSWTESECDKLLKCLRHTSDFKHMNFFIQMVFPPDYSAYVSKAIAWDLCRQKLDNGNYDTIGEIVADLRLIFSNALKYNSKARESNEISKAAYASAIHMSKKLEVAIDKMLLAVADRVGREKIDMITTQREMEAFQRAEEEQMKLKWEKENPSSSRVEVKTTLRIVHQRGGHRKKTTDFDFPFYDEEDYNDDTHDDSLRHAKSLFEKQQKARVAMKEISLAVGLHVYRKLDQRAAARAWVYRMAYKAHMERIRKEEKLKAFKKSTREEAPVKKETISVSAVLNDAARKQIKISLPQSRKTKRKLLTSL